MICECLKKVYVSIYSECPTGTDKHAKFQLKWYQHCSSMLNDCTNDIEYHPCLNEAAKKWVEFKNAHSSYCSFHLLCIMISIQCFIFKELAKLVADKVSVVTSKNTDQPSTMVAVEEPDDVYYEFGGAAIAEMLHNRYRSIHASPYSKRNIIATEITILKAMECKDKIRYSSFSKIS